MANQTDDQVHAVPTHEDASDAVKQGQEAAFENAQAERAASTNEGASREEIVEDAQETAELNHKVDVRNQPELNQEDGFSNNTTKKAKTATAKSQLDPSGGDESLQRKINGAARRGENPEPGTDVSNEEAARRAAETTDDTTETTGVTEDASGNPTLGNGETNVPASQEVTNLGSGDAKLTASGEAALKDSSDSADKS